MMGEEVPPNEWIGLGETAISYTHGSVYRKAKAKQKSVDK